MPKNGSKMHNFKLKGKKRNGKNIIVAIEDINIRKFTNNLTLDLFIIR